ncbi:MAG TPA: sterol desaturase family protein [Planctomycetota bacterium]|nr:sterol desaturase family protein [Planctomycetota bacterium]
MRFEPESRKSPPIRLFRSDFLESLTHVHPAVVVLVWLPVIAWFLRDGWHAQLHSEMPVAVIASGFVGGLFVWTFVEYALHRCVFHFAPPARFARLERLVFLFHGIHHVQPWDKTRLVMPPAVSIPLAMLFYLLFAWVLDDLLASPDWLAPTFAGFLTGYLAYDLMHYATHHLPMRHPALKWLKRHHLLHHHATPDDRFGVSSPLWDVLLRTMPRSGNEDDVDERLGLG